MYFIINWKICDIMLQDLTKYGTFSLQPYVLFINQLQNIVKDMNRLNRYVDSMGVDQFFGWGGGGQSKKTFNLSGALRAQIHKY